MNYVSLQFAGKNITDFINAIEDYFNTVYATILSYLSSLSITTANEKHTEMIGRLIGFPRPLVQQELLNSFLFKFSISYYKDSDMGFAATYGTSGGGLFSAATTDNGTTYLDLATYKSMLKIIAKAKANSSRYSLTLIDDICKYAAGGNNYIITWANNEQDIVVTFYDVNVYAIYIAGYILNYLFDSVPDITVIKETT
jgi:hypothetical protein